MPFSLQNFRSSVSGRYGWAFDLDHGWLDSCRLVSLMPDLTATTASLMALRLSAAARPNEEVPRAMDSLMEPID